MTPPYAFQHENVLCHWFALTAFPLFSTDRSKFGSIPVNNLGVPNFHLAVPPGELKLTVLG